MVRCACYTSIVGSAVTALATSIGAELLRASLVGTPAPRLGGRYQVLALLGRGATGVVVRAWDLQLERQAALKIAPSSTASATMLKEGRALAQLRRPRHVVQVYDVGEATLEIDGAKLELSYVAMELLEGMSLRAWLQTRRPTNADVVGMFAGVAAGLVDVHRLGIVHGDVKIDNVVVDRQGIPLLVDFGFAGVVGRNHGGVPGGAVAGTRPYLAPEARRGRARRRSDVYALGVSLWEVLTGLHPFGGEAPKTNWLGLLPALPRQETLPFTLRRLLRRALSPSAGRRPTSAELCTALTAAARGYAPRPRRRRWSVIAVAVVAMLVSGAIVFRHELRSMIGDWRSIPTTPPPGTYTLTTERPTPRRGDPCGSGTSGKYELQIRPGESGREPTIERTSPPRTTGRRTHGIWTGRTLRALTAEFDALQAPWGTDAGPAAEIPLTYRFEWPARAGMRGPFRVTRASATQCTGTFTWKPEAP